MEDRQQSNILYVRYTLSLSGVDVEPSFTAAKTKERGTTVLAAAAATLIDTDMMAKL